MWLLWLISTAVSYAGYKKAKKRAKELADAMAGVLLNRESNNEQIPVIYGKRRVGGTRVFVSTKDVSGGDKNEYLYIALVLAEGEVQSISNIEIDDKPMTDSRFSGLVTINTHLGTDNQTYDTLLAETPEWTSNHRLRGVAYLAIRLKWNQDAFSGMPKITAEVEGRKVYDPRNSSTAYSTNPALCLRDYLTNSRYGKGLPTSAIDDTAFSTAANDCDQTVTFYTSGNTGKIFECNAVLNTDRTLFDNVNTLLMGMRGFLPYSQGEYSLKIDKSGTSVFDFTDEHILSGIKVVGETKEEKFNRVILKFPNPDANWQPDSAIWPDAGSSEETSYLNEDGIELVDEIELETTTNYYAARDLARILVLRSRNALRSAIQVTSEGFQVEVGDVITVTHPTPGWSQKPFQVEQVGLNSDGTCGLQLVEYDSTIYSYDPSAQQQTYPDTDLPDPFSVAPVTNLSAVGAAVSSADGSTTSAIDVTWIASADSFVSSYELTFTDSVGTTETVPVVGTRYRVSNLDSNLTYTISVKAVNSAGVRSTAVSVSNISPSVDTTAPGAPTNVSVTGTFKQIKLDWTNPTDIDFSHVEIKRAGTSIEGDAVFIDKTVSNSYADGPFEYPATRYYWIRSVDRTGNASSWVSLGAGTSLSLGAGDYGLGLIDFEFLSIPLQATDLISVKNDETQALTSLENLLATYNEGEDQRKNFAEVSNSIQAIANENEAIVTDTTTLKTTVDDHTASISTSTASINGIRGQYSVTIDNNGNISGFGLVSDIIDGNPTSQFKVAADQFVIAGSGAASDVPPFAVYTQNTTVTKNGKTFTIPAGAYMQSAYFDYIDADLVKTGTLQADLIELDDQTIQAGTNGIQIKNLGVTNAHISGAIQSNNYSSTVGWKIDKSGTAVLNSATFRGTLSAPTGTLGAITLSSSGHIKSGQTGYNLGTGFFLGKSGGVPKFSIGSSTGGRMTWNGSNLEIYNATTVVASGNIPLVVSTKNNSYNVTSWTIDKSITVAVSGTVKAKAYFKTQGSLQTVYAAFRKNSSSTNYNATSTSNNSSFTTIEQNFNVHPGDVIHVAVKSYVSTHYGLLGSFGLYVDTGSGATVTQE